MQDRNAGLKYEVETQVWNVGLKNAPTNGFRGFSLWFCTPKTKKPPWSGFFVCAPMAT